MAVEKSRHSAIELAIAVTKLLLLACALPLIAASVAGYSPAPALALLMSTFIIEYGAAPVGLGLKFHPLYVLFTLCCVALGVTLFIFDIIDILGGHSERVKRFLERSAERGRNSRILARYGIYGLVPCVMTLGFYACPPVSCIFGWNRGLSVLLIMAGFAGVSVATILVTLGVFGLFSG